MVKTFDQELVEGRNWHGDLVIVNVTIICNYNGHNKYFYASITVVFDAECPFWDQASLNNTKLQTPKVKNVYSLDLVEGREYRLDLVEGRKYLVSTWSKVENIVLTWWGWP